MISQDLQEVSVNRSFLLCFVVIVPAAAVVRLFACCKKHRRKDVDQIIILPSTTTKYILLIILVIIFIMAVFHLDCKILQKRHCYLYPKLYINNNSLLQVYFFQL